MQLNVTGSVGKQRHYGVTESSLNCSLGTVPGETGWASIPHQSLNWRCGLGSSTPSPNAPSSYDPPPSQWILTTHLRLECNVCL